MPQPEPDFQLLFEQSPDVLLVLLPDAPRYTMVAATRARYAATHSTPEQTIGRGLFELFPDNPDDPAATGTSNLRASLDRVLATRAADTMAVQKYDIRGPDGSFQVKYWSPKNEPVLSSTGEVQFILHRVEDVTDLVKASELGEELRDRTRAMERDVINRSRELAVANRELRDANVKLGELDAAKTAFFSNVSHEFRTPLTLMLGPLEDALSDKDEPLGSLQRVRIELAHANALRLLKLVNTLLDFSRLEAGRMSATYAPLEFGGFTAELAGMFQSAGDRAGVHLTVDSPPLTEPLWVDRDLLEKVVSNLVSNAFKFTHAGRVVVRVREQPERVVLEVEDTGIGIPDDELQRIFERFHRVPDALGRTHEGSGIGLSLVRELVELHGGRVSVESEIGRGSRFRVELQKGYAHLPAEAVSHKPTDVGNGRNAAAYASEATRWSGSNDTSRRASDATNVKQDAATPRARILIVDDNADLRDYISRLLALDHEVSAEPDGLAALDAIRARMPDLVVSDVMMPRLDGFGLVRALRADPSTASLPVILLSARAGEEASIEGLDTGADDYLVKPFSARELLARVRTHVELARTRRAWIAELEAKNRELDAFSYSVSHDLRAPLRAVDGFSQGLAQECAAVLDARGKDYLGRIRGGVKRMNALIDDMLELARITRLEINAETIDLSTLAAGVVADLRRVQPERSVRVDLEAGLVVRADRRLLNIALVNLIGNAWKYSSRTEQAQIEIGRLPDAEPTFFVRDNGAGFDMTHAHRLFAPFQRLHKASEFEGTGVGLATVQRVLARHAGRIWVEAAVGRGATFFFTLPQGRALRA